MLLKQPSLAEHRGSTLAFSTSRLGGARKQQYVLLIEAFAVAVEKRQEQLLRGNHGIAGVDQAIRLVHVLCNEAGITDDVTLAAAVLYDTCGETQAAQMELRRQFGPVVAGVVSELTDQIEGRLAPRDPLAAGSGTVSHRAKMIIIASQIVALRHPGSVLDGWGDVAPESLVVSARAVVDALRGTPATLEWLFDEELDRLRKLRRTMS
ncbi:MAG: HD domain-containing protein [Burkholderiales bacterium]|nr:HD domain-containing protein [Burkholderiales bacterium]